MPLNSKRKSGLAACVTLMLTVGLLCGFDSKNIYGSNNAETSGLISGDLKSYLGEDPFNQIPNPDLYSYYSPYGLVVSENGDALIYNGQKVRMFADEHSDWHMAPMAFYLNEGGEADLSVTRNPAGEITGIEYITEEKARYFVDAFFASDLSEHELAKGEEKLYELEQYQPYGITFSINGDRMYYQDQRVGIFGFESAVDSDFVILWTDTGGTVDLSAVRNSSGEITGIERIPEEKASEMWDKLEVAESPNKYLQYQSYGITYFEDSQTLLYNGQIVRAFVDKHLDGFNEAFWEDKRGTVDLLVVRNQSDDIVGIEVVSVKANAASDYVIECASENVIIKQEGTEFKVEVDPQSESYYHIRDNTNIPMNDRYYRYSKWDMIFERKDRDNTEAEYSAVVTVTVPQNAHSLYVNTSTGNINIENLTGVDLLVESTNGDIYIAYTSVTEIDITAQGKIQLMNLKSTLAGGIIINEENYYGGEYMTGPNGEHDILLNT